MVLQQTRKILPFIGAMPADRIENAAQQVTSGFRILRLSFAAEFAQQFREFLHTEFIFTVLPAKPFDHPGNGFGY